MRYDFIIENDGKQEVSITSEKAIKMVEFKLNSLDDDSVERDRNARCEVKIIGEIDSSNYEETVKIARWSIEKESVFRRIIVRVNDPADGNVTLRTFKLDRMFCVDYTEKFDENADACIFELSMAQSPHGKEKLIRDYFEE